MINTPLFVYVQGDSNLFKCERHYDQTQHIIILATEFPKIKLSYCVWWRLLMYS